ncbi:hypothetical protein [Loktanella sp. M215]|uniref:hypothetical protein n=1 Tax=Loktanella sp. M215 TaxID=2675431 RepID=UPI001F3C6E05|nr:hypothetical protein [Loktanella sp. M215]MCF7699812.1 hypothetical protein [Loktanella sp. M215]
MLVPLTSIAAPSPLTVPIMDHRPTADAAALARDPTPFIPLPMPSQYTQKGAVAEARMTDTSDSITKIERVLKPYGVTMLPRGQADTKAQTDSREPQDPAVQAQADADDGSATGPAPDTGSDPAASGVRDPRPIPVPLPG